jgi:hypothetical protein
MAKEHKHSNSSKGLPLLSNKNDYHLENRSWVGKVLLVQGFTKFPLVQTQVPPQSHIQS